VKGKGWGDDGEVIDGPSKYPEEAIGHLSSKIRGGTSFSDDRAFNAHIINQDDQNRAFNAHTFLQYVCYFESILCPLFFSSFISSPCI